MKRYKNIFDIKENVKENMIEYFKLAKLMVFKIINKKIKIKLNFIAKFSQQLSSVQEVKKHVKNAINNREKAKERTYDFNGENLFFKITKNILEIMYIVIIETSVFDNKEVDIELNIS